MDIGGLRGYRVLEGLKGIWQD